MKKIIDRNKRYVIPSEFWNAIVANDNSFDNRFFYGVRTTKIFCRPSCKSKVPNKENVLIFKNAEAALNLGFRPCKRCKPDNLFFPNEEWVELICKWINKHYHNDITLDVLAKTFHASPYHLQRTFKKFKGHSPSQYLQRIRLNEAAKKLEQTNNSIQNISSSVGFSNSAYFITLFKKFYKMTPNKYRKKMKEEKPKK